MSANKPNILFYSPKCEYSNKIVQMINQAGIIDMFVMVNISNPSYQLPKFVDRVPMIFIKNKNELVVDDHIPRYIESLVPRQHMPQHQQQQMPQQMSSQQQQQQEPVMMTLSDISANNFSFIDDKDGGMGAGKNFDFIQNDQPNQAGLITTIQTETIKSSKFDSSEFERFSAQRDMDMAQFKQSAPPRV